MNYCSKCGTKNDSEAVFCIACGSKLTNSFPEKGKTDVKNAIDPTVVVSGQRAVVQSVPIPATAHHQQPFTPYQEKADRRELDRECESFGKIGYVCGIISTCLCWLGVFRGVGLLMGFVLIGIAIIGLIFSARSRRRGKFDKANAGKILSILGIIFSGICFYIGIFLSVHV